MFIAVEWVELTEDGGGLFADGGWVEAVVRVEHVPRLVSIVKGISGDSHGIVTQVGVNMV